MISGDLTFRRRAFVELSAQDLHDLLRLRGDVFVVEQGICSENDIDGRDPHAVHVLARDEDGSLAATARIEMEQSPVVVSRVTVARTHRGRGVGSALMRYVQLYLGPCGASMSAQEHLLGFYTRLGWTPEGETYDEVGIPHRRLVHPGAAREATD